MFWQLIWQAPSPNGISRGQTIKKHPKNIVKRNLLRTTGLGYVHDPISSLLYKREIRMTAAPHGPS